MKSDEYLDREKFGNAIMFMIKCNPYQGIERALKVPKQIHEEYVCWSRAGRLINRCIELAKITEALKYHIKSK